MRTQDICARLPSATHVSKRRLNICGDTSAQRRQPGRVHVLRRDGVPVELRSHGDEHRGRRRGHPAAHLSRRCAVANRCGGISDGGPYLYGAVCRGGRGERPNRGGVTPKKAVARERERLQRNSLRDRCYNLAASRSFTKLRLGLCRARTASTYAAKPGESLDRFMARAISRSKSTASRYASLCFCPSARSTAS